MRVTFSLILVMLLQCSAVGQGGSDGSVDSVGRSIDSPREALEVALAYTGFKEIAGFVESEDFADVNVIKLNDSTIPFMVNRLYNKPVWHIYLDSVHLDYTDCSRSVVEKYNPKKFHILIDSTTGVFIKAYTKWERDPDPTIGSEPSASSAERQIRGDGVFLSFCKSAPQVTLYQALGAAPGSYPFHSKELTILLVRHMYGVEERSLWHILSRGFPPERFRTAEVTFNYAHSVVDGESGKWLYRDLAPHPVINRPSEDD